MLEFEERLRIAALPQQPEKLAPSPKHMASRAARAPNKQQQQQQQQQLGGAADEGRGTSGAGMETESSGGRQSGGSRSSGDDACSGSELGPFSSSLSGTSSAKDSDAESDLGSHGAPSSGQPSGAADAPAEAEGKITAAGGGTQQQAQRDEEMLGAEGEPDGWGDVGGQGDDEESSDEESG